MHILAIGAAHGLFYYQTDNFHAGTSHLIFEDYSHGELYAHYSPVTFYDVTFKADNSFMWGGNISHKLVFQKTGYIQYPYYDNYIHDAEFWDDFSFNGSWNFHKFRLFPGRYYVFQAGTTQTIVPDISNPTIEGEYEVSGQPGQFVNFKSGIAGAQAFIHMDNIDSDNHCNKYNFLTDMNHTGTEEMYEPGDAVNPDKADVDNNDGWLFSPCNPCPATIPTLAASSQTAVCTPGNAVLVLNLNSVAGEYALWYDNLQDCLAETNPVYFGGNDCQPFLSGTSATYYARVYSQGGVCTSTVYLTVTITGSPKPATFNLTGGGAFCSGGSGRQVGLDGSETSANYTLYLDGSSIGSPIAGTGAAISFGNQTIPGVYTIVATATASGCTALQTGSTTISENLLPVIQPDGVTAALQRQQIAVRARRGVEKSTCTAAVIDGVILIARDEQQRCV